MRSSQIASIANMIGPTNLESQDNGFTEEVDHSEDHDDELSGIEAANDRSSDDDYGPRKSLRKHKPTRKALQCISENNASLNNDDVSSEGFPPHFDRGRFPMLRRV